MLRMDYHHPVMIKEVDAFIKKQIEYKKSQWATSDLVIFDGTLGHAGHLIYLLKTYLEDIKLYVATDADANMYRVAEERIKEELWADESRINLFNCSYVRLSEISNKIWKKYDVVFLDLWVNLWHFKQHERGFSIKWEGDLDMRYNANSQLWNSEFSMMWNWELRIENSELTAADVLNSYSEKQIVDMFVLNSEISMPTSTKIAAEIVRMRKDRPWETSTQLNNLTIKLWYSARVAAIVFQALRIEVNQEFQNIKKCIELCSWCMNPGGILMVLSYHSGEDRIVKEMLKDFKENGIWDNLTKHALPPSYQETIKNKPSRSARLRVFRFNKVSEE